MNSNEAVSLIGFMQLIQSNRQRLVAFVMSGFGTFETSGDVRSSVAIEGKADVTRTVHFGSE
jgi:hypothetical protein